MRLFYLRKRKTIPWKIAEVLKSKMLVIRNFNDWAVSGNFRLTVEVAHKEKEWALILVRELQLLGARRERMEDRARNELYRLGASEYMQGIATVYPG